MASPMLTVVVLVVLWLIVVVPMILRRNDERAQERSIQRFGRAMRALTRRHAVAAARPAPRVPDSDEATLVRPRIVGPRGEVFVLGAGRVVARSGRKTSRSSRPESLAVRRPVPAAQEALMYPVERSEMSAARQQMMNRRRRSLVVLGGGSLLMLLLAVTVGGGLFWVAAIGFLAGLSGYVYFLRARAMRDRDRREHRQERAYSRRSRSSYDVTEREEFFVDPPASVVRIDDDDPSLHNLDTVDLTGLYSDEGAAASAAQRRAS